MKFDETDPPRVYEVGFGETIQMHDCGELRLEPDEQVTLTTEAGAEYDVSRKDWGFYATPSLNSRLEGFGLRGVLVKNRLDRFFVLLVECGKEELFGRYLEIEALEIICWLDSSDALGDLEQRFK